MLRNSRAASLAAVCFLGASLPSAAAAQSAIDRLVPAPAHVERRAGDAYQLPARLTIVSPSATSRDAATLLAAELRRRTHREVGVAPRGPEGSIRFDVSMESANQESYALTSSRGGVTLHAATATGAIWAAQTAAQLLDSAGGWHIDGLRIDDAPAFAWRGTLVDVGRHFLPVADVERHIELLSRLKLNVMHWHLTEDQGWRLAIAKYPRLTSVGAWRRGADSVRYGGYYTPADVRRVVAFARAHGVTVVPELEMPGHSTAAIASYPHLGCTGAQIPVATTWGVFTDIYCAGKESTFEFLFAVLDEVMTLFPSPVIHLGGDEAPKDRWRDCESCQAVMRREGLKDEEALQSWFMGRVAQYVAKRGRRVMGWDEVMDGPYVPNGMVQSWRDSSYTRTAVLRGFDVVAAPGAFTYIDHTAKELPAQQVYKFDPVPPGLTAAQRARVLGGEAPLWSEKITSRANQELMALPRLLPFSERLWNAVAPSWEAFVPRMRAASATLAAEGWAVGPEDTMLADFAVRYDSAAKTPVVRVRSLANGVTLRVTTDGRAPSAASATVVDGAPLHAVRVARIQPFWKTTPILEERRVEFATHLAVGAKVTVSPAPGGRYQGTGTQTLVDGLYGSSEFGDGLWQAWNGADPTAEIDLGASRTVREIVPRFLQATRSWIVMPKRVEVQWSADGVSWSAPVALTHDIPVGRDGTLMHDFSAKLPPATTVRFIRVHAINGGLLPPGHPGAGKTSWVFADEIVVR